MKAWSLRQLDAGAEDRRFLLAMLYEAAVWRPGGHPRPEEVLTDVHVARYATGWSRPGDFGLVAVTGEGERLGAAWYRLFGADAPGYGFVADDVPELTLAVRPAVRRRGIGTELLAGLVERAKSEGRRALSLSVDPDNPAVRLYRRAGFDEAAASEGSLTLRLDLEPH